MEREQGGREAEPEGAPAGQSRAEGGGPGPHRERRESYLGFVAHEARNPLATALWSAELLGRISPEERGGARGEKLAATCRRALGRLRHLVEDHLFSERLDAGGLPAHPEAVALEELVSAAARRAGVEARGDLARDLLVLADRTSAERAVEGALAAAGREGASVEVDGRPLSGRVMLRVRGAEPPPQALEDPRRGRTPLDRERPLALSMARRAARAAGGRLAVEGGAYLLDLPAA
ncbi:MAG TPA: histidine kinase dimerization/phospho-acceptor domain-containing protein [Anaeromyxobacteraceae bacterium]|nr:histidine kinase dimerization/phospho-acceptor domain-containing protein [Anaeromyxobacteraceae bacterium]